MEYEVSLSIDCWKYKYLFFKAMTDIFFMKYRFYYDSNACDKYVNKCKRKFEKISRTQLLEKSAFLHICHTFIYYN